MKAALSSVNPLALLALLVAGAVTVNRGLGYVEPTGTVVTPSTYGPPGPSGGPILVAR